MASMLSILLASMVVLAASAPVPLDDVTTTARADGDYALETLVEVIGIVVPVEVEATTAEAGGASTEAESEEAKHEIVRRSPMRGDNSNNDLLAASDALKYDGAESSLIGHKIKFLPSWAG